MASIEKLKFFEINIGLRTSLEAKAGNTPQEAAQGRYKTKSNAPRSIFESLLDKIGDAISNQQPTIDVTIQDDKWIIKDKN